MRNVMLACLLLAVAVTAQQPQGFPPGGVPQNGQPAGPPPSRLPPGVPTTIYESQFSTRILPADVLRDFPGLCFASTLCQSFEVGATWQLGAFCGQATCMKNATGYFEKVEDCGPIPKANEKCQVVPPRPGLRYPECCLQYECTEDTTLVFPTEAEVRADIEKARKEREQEIAKAKQQAAAQA